MLQTVRNDIESTGNTYVDRLRAIPIPKPWHGLTGQFTIAALGVFVNGMTLLGMWTANQIEKGVIEHSVSSAALHLDSFVEPHIQSLATGNVLPDSATQALSNLTKQSDHGDHIAGVRIWSPGLKTIWSNVGSAPADVLAQVGKVLISQPPETAHLFTSKLDNESGETEPMLHIYAPVHKAGTMQVIAVAELIQTAEELKKRVDRSRMETVVAFVLLSSAMLLPLVIIVRRGSKTISEQREALSDRVLELGEHLERISQLQDRLVEAQGRSAVVREKTLRRIGADLHDGPIQSLAIALLRLDNLRPASTPESADPAPEFEALESVLREAMTDMRQLSAGLFLPDLEGKSLGRTIDIAVVNHERRSKTRVTTEFGPGLEASAPMIALACVYRFVQEGLTNAKRHADGIGQHVEAFVEDQFLTVSVSDTGPGMKRGGPPPSDLEGLGLIGMRERLETVGGRLTISSNEPSGVKLTAHIDLRYSRGEELRDLRLRC